MVENTDVSDSLQLDIDIDKIFRTSYSYTMQWTFRGAQGKTEKGPSLMTSAYSANCDRTS